MSVFHKNRARPRAAIHRVLLALGVLYCAAVAAITIAIVIVIACGPMWWGAEMATDQIWVQCRHGVLNVHRKEYVDQPNSADAFRLKLFGLEVDVRGKRESHDPGYLPSETSWMLASEDILLLDRQVRLSRIRLPLWMPAVAAVPSVVLVVWLSYCVVRRTLRKKHGMCVWCGYDLRGSSGGRCSECGRERS